MLRAAILALVLCGCTTTPGCYVGISLLPPGPFIHCGLDAAPAPKPDKEQGEDLNV